MFLFISVFILYYSCTVNSSDVSVEIDPNLLTNIISKDFVSFNIESNYIFDTKGFLKRDKLECIKNTLSPAYLQIKAPTTDDLLLENSNYKRKNISFKKNIIKKVDKDEFTFEQMGLFLDWLQFTNFTPYIVLKNNVRNHNGGWNTKLAIRSLSLADTLEIENSVWQLDNDCNSLDTSMFVNDLKTLESILETFDIRKNDKWMITAGDISSCLADDLKANLKDLLTSDDYILEGMVINNDTHLEALDELNEESPDITNVILYKTVENNENITNERDAINWLNTLGTSANNGYAAVFRDLNEDFSTPSLTYYSSLLYKKLVGRRVLHISQTNPSKDVSIFAHCATLSGGPVSGGVTIFATNSADEKKTISIDLVVPDENSEIMQYVLYLNEEGKIIINENDLQPIVQKVSPFKKLTVTLPPRSFGFWVVSNTNVNLCALEEEFVENIFNKLNDENQVSDNDKEPSVEAVRGKRDSFGKLKDANEGNLQWKNGIHLSPNQIDIILSKASENNKIHDLKELFSLLGQLASLIELQEEFLDISSDIFKSPMMEGFIDQDKLNTFTNDINKITNVIPSTPNPGVIRVLRSINQKDSINSESTGNENEKHIDNERLASDVECESCIDPTEILKKQRINSILNKIRNRKPLPLNIDNVFRNAQAEHKEVDKLEPAVDIPRNVDDEEVQPSELDQTNVLDAFDSEKTADRVNEEEASMDEPNLIENKPCTSVAEPSITNNEDGIFERESKGNHKPFVNLPTLAPLLRIKNTKLSEKTLTNLQPLDKTKSLNDLVRKAQDLLVKVSPRSQDVLESKILEDRVGLPHPSVGTARLHIDNLSLEFEKNKLRLQDLRNKIQLKLAELRTKQFLDRHLHRLRKRSIDTKSKSTSHRISKKRLDAYFKNLMKNSQKSDSIKNTNFKSSSNNLDVHSDRKKVLRVKRLISDDVDDSENSIDSDNELYFHKHEDLAKVTPSLFGITDKINVETSKTKPLSNEIVKENPESSDECFTVSVTNLQKSKPIDETKPDDESLEVIGENVSLTINWLNEVIRNLKSFASSIKQKLADTWVLKNLF